MVTFILLVIGGLNWLLVGLFEFDLVASIAGGMTSMLAKVIYVLVGLSAIAELAMHKKMCCCCGACSSGTDSKSCQCGTQGGSCCGGHDDKKMS